MVSLNSVDIPPFSTFLIAFLSNLKEIFYAKILGSITDYVQQGGQQRF